MTEQDWLTYTDPQPMLEFLRGKASDRKFRLFAVACCRRIWHLLTDERSRSAVEGAELYAEGSIDEAEFFAIYSVQRLALDGITEIGPMKAGVAAGFCVYFAFTDESHTAMEPGDAPFNARSTAKNAAWAFHPDQERSQYERVMQIVLLRCIFGNPFRPITLKPAWLSSTVTNLAQSIYADRSFEKMPILADALEDAGCCSQEILEHCRLSQTHTRGCWVLDHVLGKE